MILSRPPTVILILLLALVALAEKKLTATMASSQNIQSTSGMTVNFAGVITDETGRLVRRMQVVCLHQGKVVWESNSGNSGRFQLENIAVEPGNYEVIATDDRLGYVRKVIEVLEGQAGATFDASLSFDRPDLRICPNCRSSGSQYQTIKVFYATDRAPLLDSPGQYGSARYNGNKMLYGILDVSVPRIHELAALERPTLWHFEFREDRSKHFVILHRTPTSDGYFFTEISRLASESTKHDVLLFIHGFNVTFDDAGYRTAQLAYDLGFKGIPVMYSWPSNGSVFQYTQDTSNNEWTVSHLQNFLQELAAKTHAHAIHIIAHSIGNKALCYALSQLGRDHSNVSHFHNVILTAPDIDADIFRKLAAEIKQSADHITLYSSSNDRALQASKAITLTGGPAILTRNHW